MRIDLSVWQKNDLIRVLEYARDHKRQEYKKTGFRFLENDINTISELLRIVNGGQNPKVKMDFDVASNAGDHT